jgi:hypothetical protein
MSPSPHFRELGLGESALRAAHEARPYPIAAVGADFPHLFRLIPGGRSDGGLKNGQLVEIVAPGD